MTGNHGPYLTERTDRCGGVSDTARTTRKKGLE